MNKCGVQLPARCQLKNGDIPKQKGNQELKSSKYPLIPLEYYDLYEGFVEIYRTDIYVSYKANSISDRSKAVRIKCWNKLATTGSEVLSRYKNVFLQEMKTLTTLKHNNIIQLLQMANFGKDDQLALVTSYYDSLRKIFKNKNLSEKLRADDLLSQLSRALDHIFELDRTLQII